MTLAGSALHELVSDFLADFTFSTFLCFKHTRPFASCLYFCLECSSTSHPEPLSFWFFSRLTWWGLIQQNLLCLICHPFVPSFYTWALSISPCLLSCLLALCSIHLNNSQGQDIFLFVCQPVPCKLSTNTYSNKWMNCQFTLHQKEIQI